MCEQKWDQCWLWRLRETFRSVRYREGKQKARKKWVTEWILWMIWAGPKENACVILEYLMSFHVVAKIWDSDSWKIATFAVVAVIYRIFFFQSYIYEINDSGVKYSTCWWSFCVPVILVFINENCFKRGYLFPSLSPSSKNANQLSQLLAFYHYVSSNGCDKEQAWMHGCI